MSLKNCNNLVYNWSKVCKVSTNFHFFLLNLHFGCKLFILEFHIDDKIDPTLKQISDIGVAMR